MVDSSIIRSPTTFQLRTTLLAENPVVGVDVSLNVHVRLPDGHQIPEHNVNFAWYRDENERAICHLHPTEMATIQCHCYGWENMPVEKSYFCSAQCYKDAWDDHHRKLHFEAAPSTSKTSDRVLGKSTSCFAQRYFGSYSKYEDDDSIVTEVDEIDRSWVKVGSSNMYRPTKDDFGRLLKLEAIAVNHKDGNPLTTNNVTVTGRVIHAPTLQPRCMIQMKLEDHSSVSGAFRVLSYNILSDVYVNRECYGYCPTWALTWEYRRQNLLQEIIGYEADIICLQEVQSDHFEKFFLPELGSRGYFVVYKKKNRTVYTLNKSVIDGCATFFRSSKFREVKRYELHYSEPAQEVADKLQPAEMQREALKRLYRDNVAVVVILELRENSTLSETLARRICVANTHIIASSIYCDIKLWQVSTLVAGLEKINAADIPVIICCDLNSVPLSAPHNLLAQGQVDPSERTAEDPLGLYEHFKLSHRIPLASAYSSLLNVSSNLITEKQKKMMHASEKMMDSTKEPLFTNYTGAFCGTLDYIFYTETNLEVQGVLELLDFDSAKKYKALPSPEWSSDHIALIAEFTLKDTQKKSLRPPLPDSLW